MAKEAETEVSEVTKPLTDLEIWGCETLPEQAEKNYFDDVQQEYSIINNQ